MDVNGSDTWDAAEAPLVVNQITGDVLDSLGLGVVIFDRTLRIIYRNHQATCFYPGGERMDAVLASATVEGQYEDWSTALRQVMQDGTPRRFEGVLCRIADDENRLFSLVCTPLKRARRPETVGATLVAEDVTLRASLEQRLAVSDRLAAVGKLAARVAHELNNPLDGTLRFINLALRLLEPGEDQPDGAARAVKYLEESRHGLQRMAQIVSELLEFARSGPTPPDHGNINRVVEEAVRTMSARAERAGIVVVAALQEEAMPCLPGIHLYQVCCNLIKNAIDAMPGGGRLTIHTTIIDRDVVLCFEDTGVGLPDVPDKIFEPFFTTKPAGQGTGLGLAICRESIERLRGSIAAQRRPEGGARLTVHIPLASCTPVGPARDAETAQENAHV